MTEFFPDLPAATLALALAIGLVAGFVKGVVGFAMPMILITGLSTFLPPDLALAALILPTVVTNGQQALRQGWAAAWASTRRFWVFLATGLVFLLVSAQFVAVMSQQAMFALIGVPITAFALVQIAGWRPVMTRPSAWIEAAVGALAGLMGGVSGVWGPPTLAYLIATDTSKEDQIRVQGVIYFLGAVALLGAHLRSGVLRADTWALSALMILPALAGMGLGLRLQSRLDQAAFRKATLIVLALVGLNLVRRALA